MKKPFGALLFILALSFSVLAQTSTESPASSPASTPNNNAAATKRPPVFKASKDQVMQAQKMLKDKGIYAGEQTGKLDEPTREALSKYQIAEAMSPTGTLNRATLEKMNVALTEKQKEMPITTAKPKESQQQPRAKTFRATKDQIMQVQKMLKDKSLYAGESDGKMNDDFRASVKKYQETEGLRVTGTLSRETIEKMGVSLTDKQKAMPMTTSSPATK